MGEWIGEGTSGYVTSKLDASSPARRMTPSNCSFELPRVLRSDIGISSTPKGGAKSDFILVDLPLLYPHVLDGPMHFLFMPAEMVDYDSWGI